MKRLMTVGLATLAALSAWFLLTQTAGIELAARTGPSSTTQVAAGFVAVVAAGAGFAAWALLAALERLTGGRARRIWIITAAAVLAVSLLGPMSGVGAAAVLGLLGLHLVVGLVLITGLPRPATPR